MGSFDVGDCSDCCCPLRLRAEADCCEFDGSACVDCGPGSSRPTVLHKDDCAGEVFTLSNSSERRHYKPDEAEVLDHYFRSVWPVTAGVAGDNSYLFYRQRLNWDVGAESRQTDWIQSRVGRIRWPFGTGSPATMLLEAEYKKGVGCLGCGSALTAEIFAASTMAEFGASLLSGDHAALWTEVVGQVNLFCSTFYPPNCRVFAVVNEGYRSGSDPTCCCTQGFGGVSVGGGGVWYLNRIVGWVEMTWQPASAGKVIPRIQAKVHTSNVDPPGTGASFLLPFDPVSGICGFQSDWSVRVWHGEKFGPEINDNCNTIRSWFDGMHIIPAVYAGSGSAQVSITWPA